MYTVHPFMTMCVCCKAAVIRLSRQKIHIKDGIWRKHLLEDWEIKLMLDSVQQARCVSVHEANEIRNKLLNLTSQRGQSRFFAYDYAAAPEMSGGVGQTLDNGKYKAVFKKMDSVTLVGWFVQYANRFKVISPESLKGKIIENLEQAQSIYSE